MIDPKEYRERFNKYILANVECPREPSRKYCVFYFDPSTKFGFRIWCHDIQEARNTEFDENPFFPFLFGSGLMKNDWNDLVKLNYRRIL